MDDGEYHCSFPLILIPHVVLNVFALFHAFFHLLNNPQAFWTLSITLFG